MDSLVESTEVLVVGAGPTGLLLAAELARRGVACLLIDAGDAPQSWDRATVVHARSMEIFEALGITEGFLARGERTRGARLHSNGQVLGELSFAAADDRYPFDIGISEEVTESILTAYLEQQGGAVTRSTRLAGLREAEDGVVATVERDGERHEVTASWVVGCDGFRSTVRELVGIELPGAEDETTWAVFDTTLDGWTSEYDVVHVYMDGPPVIFTPLPGHRWRAYVRPRSDTADLVEEAATGIRLYAPEVEFAAVENPRRFRCHARVADRFREGRVLLAGDAAHVCSPTEGHGMNTGLQDAFNLGWKLALVVQGVSAPTLLDSYEAERRPIAQRVAQSGVDVDAAQGLSYDADRAARDVALRATFADAESAHHEAVAAAELDRSYAGSDIVGGSPSDALGPGARLPSGVSVQLASGESCDLHEQTHRPGHTLLVIGSTDVTALTAALDAAYAGSPVVGAVLGFSTRAAEPGIGRIDEASAERLGIGARTVLAVRPDRYVGLRHDGGDPAGVAAYLEQFTGVWHGSGGAGAQRAH